MEESIFSPPPQVWNSSFDDNDASTTLDTSLETENDSIIRYDSKFGHQRLPPKVHTSRSSPGAPMGKEMHQMLGYFDDVDTFTTKPLHLQYDDQISPQGLPPLPQLTNFILSTGPPSADNNVLLLSDGETVKINRAGIYSRRNGNEYDLDVMHESDDGVDADLSSPDLEAPPIQSKEYGHGRRGTRSHTSQGIPSHNLLNALDSIHEDKSIVSETLHDELEKENEELREQLEATRNRLDEMSEQMSSLSLRLSEERTKAFTVNGGHSPHISPVTPHTVAHFPVDQHINGLVAPATPHYLEAFGHTTPDSPSIASLSMTPDPFSPFQRLSSGFAPHPQINHNGTSTYSPAFSFTPRSILPQGVNDTSSLSQCSPIKPNALENRIERGTKSNSSIQDLQMPIELLVAKTLGARSQDASIAMQQQLKSGTPARKQAIIEAILPHVLRLSDDKHGNFLIQRAVGVDPRVAHELKGSFVALSLSQFGCHVVQRILDEEVLRTKVVDELLSDQVFETLTCRNSIHVWQKVLEINWTDKCMRAKIFAVVNGVMKGRWADTAMQETGSIICQNIFESADVEEKEDCVSEILDRLCECAANQWGVWVVQHIIEHGNDEHRSIAYGKLLSNAVSLTLSQYGQKAIMSALKARDAFFIDQYVDILCDRDATAISPNAGGDSPTPNTRRSILVDIASAPQGVQIVTQLLTSVQPAQRERIIKTVRKNSVFLKGSKAGLRVHQLCERARAFTGY